jgi:hypothetical protein
MKTFRLTSSAFLAVCLLAGTPWVLGQSVRSSDDHSDGPVILNIDTINRVGYQYDSADVTTYATLPGQTPPIPSKNFISVIVIADITAVNGEPARGVKVDQAHTINLRPLPNPALGQAVADVNRAVITRSVWEILRPDGTVVGTIVSEGFGGGPPPPGAPSTQTASNEAIVGGTGAFLGARGQVGVRGSPPPGRVASVRENPANRRLNGGDARNYVLQLIPPFGPELVKDDASDSHH